jgi:hypothetical protein
MKRRKFRKIQPRLKGKDHAIWFLEKYETYLAARAWEGYREIGRGFLSIFAPGVVKKLNPDAYLLKFNGMEITYLPLTPAILNEPDIALITAVQGYDPTKDFIAEFTYHDSGEVYDLYLLSMYGTKLPPPIAFEAYPKKDTHT